MPDPHSDLTTYKVIKRKVGHDRGIVIRLGVHEVFVRIRPHTKSWVDLVVQAPPDVEVLREEELEFA